MGPCKSCGQQDHARSSSHKCPQYKPRPGKDPPPPRNDDGYWKAFTDKVYKTGFNSFFHSPDIRDKVNDLVKYVTAVSFEASRLLNYHILRLIEAGDPIPEVTDAFVRTMFSLFGKKRADRFYDQELLHSFAMYKGLRQVQQMPSPPLVYSGQAITIIVNEYLVNLNNHIELHFWRLSRLWILEHHTSKILSTKSEKKELIDSILANSVTTETTVLREVEWILKEAYETPGSRLQWIYLLNTLTQSYERRSCTLIPAYSYQAKYITIDTDVLSDILGQKSKTSKRQFGHDQFNEWLKVARIPKRYQPRDDNYHFNFMVKTDGVGCSVVLRKWIWLIKKDKKSPEEEKDAIVKPSYDTSNVGRLFANATVETNLFEKEFVGVDPGRKDVVSYVNDDETKRSISNKEYYTRSQFKYRTSKMERWTKQENLYEWERAFPSMSKGSVADFEDYLRYVFLTDAHAKMIDFRTSNKVKKLRWRCYIHKQKAVDEICKELIGGRDKDKLVVAFGDASFNHASKGHAPSPRRLLIRNRLAKAHGVEVLDVREFNTSRVCSSCHSHHALQNPTALKVTKPHFVRRCSNTTCQTTWNRDVNAARNIRDLGRLLWLGMKRPILYSISLKNFAHSITSVQGVRFTVVLYP